MITDPCSDNIKPRRFCLGWLGYKWQVLRFGREKKILLYFALTVLLCFHSKSRQTVTSPLPLDYRLLVFTKGPVPPAAPATLALRGLTIRTAIRQTSGCPVCISHAVIRDRVKNVKSDTYIVTEHSWFVHRQIYASFFWNGYYEYDSQSLRSYRGQYIGLS